MSTSKLVYKLQISISNSVLNPKMYTSSGKINCFIWSKIKILSFRKIAKKVAKFLATFGQKNVAKSLRKSPKWWQIATSSHTVPAAPKRPEFYKWRQLSGWPLPTTNFLIELYSFHTFIWKLVQFWIATAKLNTGC